MITLSSLAGADQVPASTWLTLWMAFVVFWLLLAFASRAVCMWAVLGLGYFLLAAIATVHHKLRFTQHPHRPSWLPWLSPFQRHPGYT